MDPWRYSAQGVAISVRVTPRGGADAIDGIETLANGRSVLKVRVRAIAEGGSANRAVTELLAKALGVEGKPLSEGGSWRVGSAGDGSGPLLRVNTDAPGAWTFSRFAPGTDNCRKADVCVSGSADGGEPVSEAVARQAAAPVLKALGQDDTKLDAKQLMGAVRVVNADPEVGGLPTYGWTTGLQVGAEGNVVGGSGMLKAPAKSDTYPVVGADEALDLLNEAGGSPDGGGGIAGCADPVPLEETDPSE